MRHHQTPPWIFDVMRGKNPTWLFYPVHNSLVYGRGYIGQTLYMVVFVGRVMVTHYPITSLDKFELRLRERRKVNMVEQGFKTSNEAYEYVKEN